MKSSIKPVPYGPYRKKTLVTKNTKNFTNMFHMIIKTHSHGPIIVLKVSFDYTLLLYVPEHAPF